MHLKNICDDDKLSWAMINGGIEGQHFAFLLLLPTGLPQISISVALHKFLGPRN
jgi:hypothetical protein